MSIRPIAINLAGWLITLTVVGPPARADVPSTTNSYFVPNAGPVDTPLEGAAAVTFFRTCPNNDALTNNARIKVVVRNAANLPITGIAAEDIGFLLNGGTPEQGFNGVGADSVIANSQFNPLCPDLRFVTADAQTGLDGTTYVTFTGATAGSPGVGTRSGLRKWGHYDTVIPVYVLGFQLQGRLTTASANGTYTLQLKNLDTTGGLGATLDQGEVVSATDFNAIANGIGVSNAVSFWRDFDSSGSVAAADFNLISQHVGHNCVRPNNP